MKKYLLILSLFVISDFDAISQEANNIDDNSENETTQKGFRVGLYIGSYFANQYTSSLYDGYGVDFDGNRNNFENSLMYQKIINQYGGYGYPGQPDQIADVLGVDYQKWTFDESDMPTNMRYRPAFLIGLQTRYSVDKKNSILLNINAAKLTINGNFTIITPQQANSTQVNNRIKTFDIKGVEQRLQFQLGYSRLLGDNEKLNFIIEGGLHGTLAKFDQNTILITDDIGYKSLQIDLTENYNQVNYNAPYIRKPIGFGLGAFAGLGLNVDINPKCTVQLLYNPTYEKINMGESRLRKIHNAIGLRAYYNL